MKKLNIAHSYISAEERFSGFDGDLELEDISNMGGPEDAEGGWSGAEGNAAAAPAPRPYSIQIANGNTVASTVVLFGFGRYLNASNYGSDSGVTVSAINSSFDYAEFVMQSALQPFTTQLIRVKATDATDATIPDVFNFNYRDIGGDALTSGVYTDPYLSEYANKNGKVSMPVSQKIHANMYITFTIAASKTIVITFYPATQNGIGRTNVKQYGNAPMVVGAPAAGGRKQIAGTRMIPANVPLR